jgi:hypothetical protein
MTTKPSPLTSPRALDHSVSIAQVHNISSLSPAICSPHFRSHGKPGVATSAPHPQPQLGSRQPLASSSDTQVNAPPAFVNAVQRVCKEVLVSLACLEYLFMGSKLTRYLPAATGDNRIDIVSIYVSRSSHGGRAVFAYPVAFFQN